MQEVHTAGSDDTTTDGTGTWTGVLENPNGVMQLMCAGVVVAKSRRGHSHLPRSDTFMSSSLKQEVHVTWSLVELDLDWERIPALKRLQGASMQQLLEPCVLLFADPRKEHVPQPGADRVLLAIIDKIEPEVPRLELFSELLQRVRHHLPFHPSL
jgi:hypothetical protein